MPIPELNTAEPWINDLIKIGIPSLGTLLSIFVTYRIGIAGHKKDLDIEKLRAEINKSKASSEKRTDLAKDVMLKITAVETAHGKFSGVFRSENIKVNSTLTGEQKIKLNSTFQDLSRAIDECTGIKSSVLLLNEPQVSVNFTLYLEKLYTFQAGVKQDDDFSDQITLGNQFLAIEHSKERLVAILSNIYMGII